MLSKMLMLSLLIAGCGNNVQLKANKLENASKLTDDQIASFQKSGVLIKGSPSRMQFQGTNFEVSIYSSKMALDFVSSLPAGSQVPVYFTGGTNANQVVIETIKRR